MITPSATIAEDANFSGGYASVQLAPTEPNLWAHAGSVVRPVALAHTWPSGDCAVQPQLKKTKKEGNQNRYTVCKKYDNPFQVQ